MKDHKENFENKRNVSNPPENSQEDDQPRTIL